MLIMPLLVWHLLRRPKAILFIRKDAKDVFFTECLPLVAVLSESVMQKEGDERMENGLDLMFETLGVFLFCLALTLTIELFHNLEQLENQTMDNLYDSHVFYSVAVE